MNVIFAGEAAEMTRTLTVGLGQFKDAYLAWLWDRLGFDAQHETLFEELAETPFHATPDVPFDEHRISDGLDLRRIFALDAGMDVPDEDKWDSWPCSVLEVLTTLAAKADANSLNVPYSRGDDCEGTRWWFWHMVGNLGLSNCLDDGGYDWHRPISNVLAKWMDRRYKADGNGGLFPMPRRGRGGGNGTDDQRKVELWYQLNQYIIARGYV